MNRNEITDFGTTAEQWRIERAKQMESSAAPESVSTPAESRLHKARLLVEKWAESCGDFSGVIDPDDGEALAQAIAIYDSSPTDISALAAECAKKVREWLCGSGLVDGSATNELALVIESVLTGYQNNQKGGQRKVGE
jgi:hypothetical protein